MATPAPLDPLESDDRVSRAVATFAPEADLEAFLLCFNLIRAGDMLNQDLEAHVHRPAGLSWAAYRLMLAVRSAGPLTPLELSRRVNVTQGSVSSGLKTLERHGLTTRKPSVVDGRSFTVHLTPDGERVLAALFVSNNDREVEWAGLLTKAERSTLLRLLRKVRSHEPAPPTRPVPKLVD